VAERGAGRAAVLLTPASPADVVSSASLAQAFTFANVLFSGKVEAKGHKIWKTGFSWGVLNRVPAAKHQGIFAGTVYDSGGVYADLAYPDRDPHRIAFIDETKITIPILTIAGGRDRATPVAGVRKVGQKYARVGGDYREYADNAHWIVDEPGTDQVIADIAAWLTAKGVTAAKAAKAAPTTPPAAKTAAKIPAKAAAKPTAAKGASRPAPTRVKAAPVKPAAAASPAKAAKATRSAPAKASAAKAPAKAPAKAKTPAKAAAAPKTSVSKPKSK
jgi:hypothetical protein